MRKPLIKPIAVLAAVVLTVGLCLIDAYGQRRTRRKAPRITNPPIAAPITTQGQVGEPKIISTAEEGPIIEDERGSTSETKKSNKSTPATTLSEQEEMRQTIDSLSTKVTVLTERLIEMQEQQRTLLDMERLSRAETRAENLRSQLRDVEAKEADMQARLEQVEFAMLPENVERAMASFGSTRPEEAREFRRKQLINEKGRLESQLRQFATSRVRLEASIANADREVDLLRERLERTDTATDEATSNPISLPKPADEKSPDRDPLPE